MYHLIIILSMSFYSHINYNGIGTDCKESQLREKNTCTTKQVLTKHYKKTDKNVINSS